MVATNQGARAETKKKRRGRAATVEAAPACVDAVTGGAAADTAPPLLPRDSGPPATRPAARKVGARDAAGRIRAAADTSELLDTRQRLRQLARQVARGGRDVQRMTFIEAAIGECLDEAAGMVSPRDRWLIHDACTWALAWMARTRRAGGSAGSLLERLVRAARVGEEACRGRDTLPARFVLTLARLFADIEACRCLEPAATAALEEEVARLVSAGGTVGLSGSAAVIDRVVRWTGVRDVGCVTGGLPWNEQTESLWAAAATSALRLLGRDGRIITGPGLLPGCFSAVLLAAAADGPLQKPARRTACRLAGRGREPDTRLLCRDLHDAAACSATIRTGWSRRDVRVLVEYREAIPRLEIAVGDRLLVDGDWGWQASLGGRTLDAEGPWVASCWESDAKASFLEIVAPLAGGMQLERQVIVLPDDRIVMLADALVPRTGGQRIHAVFNGDAAAGSLDSDALAYRGSLALAPGLETEAAGETREILAFDTAMRFMALPLALPEWRTPGRGSLTATTAGTLMLEQFGGRRLYAPLWLDFEPRRIGRPLTWRQLTVADTRQILPAHQAAGFRVQAGLAQWLVYRALDAARNRTLLGCNVSAEFLVGRIKRSGEVSRRLQIQ